MQSLPGPPFVFGSFLVVCALLVAFFIPDGPLGSSLKASARRSSGKNAEDLFGFMCRLFVGCILCISLTAVFSSSVRRI